MRKIQLVVVLLAVISVSGAGAEMPETFADISGKWYYEESEDKMFDQTVTVAMTASKNTMNLGFPYPGEAHAALTLVYRPFRNITIVSFTLEVGQISCPEDECFVTVRFHGGVPSRWRVQYPDSGATDRVRLSSTERFSYSRKFENKLVESERVLVRVLIHNHTYETFEFDLSGFDHERFRGRSQEE